MTFALEPLEACLYETVTVAGANLAHGAVFLWHASSWIQSICCWCCNAYVDFLGFSARALGKRILSRDVVCVGPEGGAGWVAVGNSVTLQEEIPPVWACRISSIKISRNEGPLAQISFVKVCQLRIRHRGEDKPTMV